MPSVNNLPNMDEDTHAERAAAADAWPVDPDLSYFGGAAPTLVDQQEPTPRPADSYPDRIPARPATSLLYVTQPHERAMPSSVPHLPLPVGPALDGATQPAPVWQGRRTLRMYPEVQWDAGSAIGAGFPSATTAPGQDAGDGTVYALSWDQLG